MRALAKKILMPTGRRERRILLGPAAGLRMELDLASEFRYWLGIYEAELAKYFGRLIQPGSRCFDVGGALGYHALVMARLSQRPVVVFEPGAGWPERIDRALARNDMSGRVEPVFVGGTIGDDVTTIDAMAEKHFVPDFIKMDIEGAEVEALEGAEKTLSTHQPAMIIEVHGVEVERQCLETLDRYDYRLRVINPRTWLKEYRPIENNRWLVCQGRKGSII